MFIRLLTAGALLASNTAIAAPLTAARSSTPAAALPPADSADPAARALIDAALERMGGSARFEAIERVRFEFMTQWQRTTFDERPYSDRPTYERHTDVRDYTIDAWRNTRTFDRAGNEMTIVDVVRGDAGVRTFVGGSARMPASAPRQVPLNVAYVDERDEVFTWSPDRLLLRARAADDLQLLADTAIGGMPHARIALTLNDEPSVLFLRRADGLPALLRVHAPHPNDFGLVPLGDMAVEVWYSSWATFPPGIHLPTQIDVRRGTRPYKRMSILHAVINPTFEPDSFALSDSLRAVFLATSTRPMHDLPIDSARTIEGSFVDFRTFGTPAGAVRVGNAWLLLGSGQAPLSAERALGWLEREHGAAPTYAINGNTALSNGGIAEMVARRIPTLIAPGFADLATVILDGYGTPSNGIEVVGEAHWLQLGGDSVRVEPIDLPNARGTLLVWVPSLHWLYAPAALTPLEQDIVLDHAGARGWEVERIGTTRGLIVPIERTASGSGRPQ